MIAATSRMSHFVRGCLLMAALCLTSCTSVTPTTVPAEGAKVPLRIAALKGPTAMGMVNLMEWSEDDPVRYPYEFTISVSADAIMPDLIKGDLDLAAVPANLAAILFNRTEGRIRVLAVNTTGVLNLLSKGEAVATIADLKGKTLFATGKGNVPEYVLDELLRSANLTRADVSVEWKSEPSEIVALMTQMESGIALIPEPFATAARNGIDGLTTLQLDPIWQASHDGHSQVTGVLVGRSDCLDERPDDISEFLEDCEASVQLAIDAPAETAVLIEQYGIVKAAIAKEALPHS